MVEACLRLAAKGNFLLDIIRRLERDLKGEFLPFPLSFNHLRSKHKGSFVPHSFHTLEDAAIYSSDI